MFEKMDLFGDMPWDLVVVPYDSVFGHGRNEDKFHVKYELFFMEKWKKEEEMEFFLYFTCDFVLDFTNILVLFSSHRIFYASV